MQRGNAFGRDSITLSQFPSKQARSKPPKWSRAEFLSSSVSSFSYISVSDITVTDIIGVENVFVKAGYHGEVKEEVFIFLPEMLPTRVKIY